MSPETLSQKVVRLTSFIFCELSEQGSQEVVVQTAPSLKLLREIQIHAINQGVSLELSDDGGKIKAKISKI